MYSWGVIMRMFEEKWFLLVHVCRKKSVVTYQVCVLSIPYQMFQKKFVLFVDLDMLVKFYKIYFMCVWNCIYVLCNIWLFNFQKLLKFVSRNIYLFVKNIHLNFFTFKSVKNFFKILTLLLERVKNPLKSSHFQVWRINISHLKVWRVVSKSSHLKVWRIRISHLKVWRIVSKPSHFKVWSFYKSSHLKMWNYLLHQYGSHTS